MFTKQPMKTEGATNKVGFNNVPAPSIISVDMRIAGDLCTEGDVQVDGVVDGDIRSTSLTIGKTAEINGEVVAEKLRICGRINGRVRAHDTTLTETAEVRGDILHQSLEISRGAFVEGMIKRYPKDQLLADKKDFESFVKNGGRSTTLPGLEQQAQTKVTPLAKDNVVRVSESGSKTGATANKSNL